MLGSEGCAPLPGSGWDLRGCAGSMAPCAKAGACVWADVSVTAGALGWEQVRAQCSPFREGDAQE